MTTPTQPPFQTPHSHQVAPPTSLGPPSPQAAYGTPHAQYMMYAQPSSQAYGQVAYPAGVVASQNGLGTSAMILGIIGLVFVWLPGLNLTLGILATIFGAVGLNRTQKGTASNKGMAVAGLSLGIATIILGLFFWMLMVAASSATSV